MTRALTSNVVAVVASFPSHMHTPGRLDPVQSDSQHGRFLSHRGRRRHPGWCTRSTSTASAPTRAVRSVRTLGVPVSGFSVVGEASRAPGGPTAPVKTLAGLRVASRPAMMNAYTANMITSVRTVPRAQGDTP